MKYVAEGSAALLPRVATPAVSGLIPDGETIVLALRPSILYIVLRRAESLIGLAAATAVTVWLSEQGYVPLRTMGVVAAGVAGMAAVMIYLFLDWMTRLYLLTDRRVMHVSGVIRQIAIEAPLDTIQSVALSRRARERLTGLGTPIFATAGGSIAEIPWDFVSRPVAVMKAAREAIDRYQRGMGGGGGEGGSNHGLSRGGGA